METTTGTDPWQCLPSFFPLDGQLFLNSPSRVGCCASPWRRQFLIDQSFRATAKRLQHKTVSCYTDSLSVRFQSRSTRCKLCRIREIPLWGFAQREESIRRRSKPNFILRLRYWGVVTHTNEDIKTTRSETRAFVIRHLLRQTRVGDKWQNGREAELICEGR